MPVRRRDVQPRWLAVISSNMGMRLCPHPEAVAKLATKTANALLPFSVLRYNILVEWRMTTIGKTGSAVGPIQAR